MQDSDKEVSEAAEQEPESKYSSLVKSLSDSVVGFDQMESIVIQMSENIGSNQIDAAYDNAKASQWDSNDPDPEIKYEEPENSYRTNYPSEAVSEEPSDSQQKSLWSWIQDRAKEVLGDNASDISPDWAKMHGVEVSKACKILFRVKYDRGGKIRPVACCPSEVFQCYANMPPAIQRSLNETMRCAISSIMRVNPMLGCVDGDCQGDEAVANARRCCRAFLNTYSQWEYVCSNPLTHEMIRTSVTHNSRKELDDSRLLKEAQGKISGTVHGRVGELGYVIELMESGEYAKKFYEQVMCFAECYINRKYEALGSAYMDEHQAMILIDNPWGSIEWMKSLEEEYGICLSDYDIDHDWKEIKLICVSCISEVACFLFCMMPSGQIISDAKKARRDIQMTVTDCVSGFGRPHIMTRMSEDSSTYDLPRTVQECERVLERWMSPESFGEVNFDYCVCSGRPSFSPATNTVEFDFNDPCHIVMHMVGHALEYSNPAAMLRCVEFLDLRIAQSGMKDTELRRAYGGYYRSDEVGNEANFKAFGKECDRAYVGKSYDCGGTEILASGMERACLDAYEFSKQDPEMFSFTFGILNGELLGVIR